jgi:hypothetical protein
MRIKRRADVGGDDLNPPAESIDEALTRLARQDTRLNPDPPTGARRRALGPARVARDRLWTGVRWLIILAVFWLIWRVTRGAG